MSMSIAPDIYNHTMSMLGTGAAFLSDSSLLTDGKPSQVTRCRWISGTQTTSSKTTFVDTVTDPNGGTPLIGAVSIEGITGLPEGLKVVFNGDTGHPVLLAPCPSGGLMARYVPAAAFSSGSVTIELYNDVSGTHPVVASAEFEVGEILSTILWAAPNGMDRQWELQTVDPSLQRNQGDNSNDKIAIVPYRTLKFNLSTVDYTHAYGVPSDSSMNLQDLGFALSRTTRCLAFPRTKTNNAIDQNVINATSIFGGVVPNGIGALQSDTGVFFKQQYQFREYPHG